MDSKNTWEIYTKYSKEFPFWIINPENKPTTDAFIEFYHNKMLSYNDDNLFRYTERTYDSLTILSKDPSIKYIWMDRTSSTPIVSKPFLYKESGYYLERVSFYATGVWKMEFKRDLISLWLQFLYNIRDNNLGNVRALTTRTNLINDNYQFEDERLQELPLKISGWKVCDLEYYNDVITFHNIENGLTKITADYQRMFSDWLPKLDYFKTGRITFTIDFLSSGSERTSFNEYYVFNTEEYGMLFIPKVEWGGNLSDHFINVNWRRIPPHMTSEVNWDMRLYDPLVIEKHLVNNKWASQFMGIYILPNWLTTSINLGRITNDIVINYQEAGQDRTFTFSNLLHVPFGTSTSHIMSINYRIPEEIKVAITNKKKLGVSNAITSFSILQSIPTYLDFVNETINFQKYPDWFDLDNNEMRFEYQFIFSGFGINTYTSKYEKVENWIKNLPNQLPSSTSKFAQYIQANQNTLQTGIWVKQEEARLNKLNAFGNAAVGAGSAVVGAVAFAANPVLGAMGMLHGMNQTIQGATNFMRADNEIKFEKARVKAKYADTFNSSTRQINYSQAIDALSKEFLENNYCGVILVPIIDNLDVYNDTIVRYGNKTYEFFKLNQLLSIKESDKYNYFEVNAENFYKETTNYQKIWDSFTFEEISAILEWLEKGVRLWKTTEVEYEYIE